MRDLNLKDELLLEQYRQASEEYRSEDRNTWRTFAIILALNGVMVSLLRFGNSQYVSQILCFASLIGIFSALAGVFIIGRTQLYQMHRTRIAKSIQNKVGEVEKLYFDSGITSQFMKEKIKWYHKLPARKVMITTLLVIAFIWLVLLLIGIVFTVRNGEKEMNLSSIIALIISVVSAAAAFGSVIFARRVWRVAKKTMIHQVLMDIQKDYSSPQMFYAIKTLKQFYKEHVKDNFVDKYESIRMEDEARISNLQEHERVQAQQYTLHYQRKIVTSFYDHLASLYKSEILPKSLVMTKWSESDLRIIPEIIIPIENKLRETLHEPPLAPLPDDCNLWLLYRASQNPPLA